MHERDGQPLTLGDVRRDFDKAMTELADRVAAEPINFVQPAGDLFARFFNQPATDDNVEPVHVPKIRLPRPGKPDPKTWGLGANQWVPTDESAPAGADT